MDNVNYKSLKIVSLHLDDCGFAEHSNYLQAEAKKIEKHFFTLYVVENAQCVQEIVVSLNFCLIV